MPSARVELEIAPSRGSIITFRIGTVEPEKNKRFFHHILRLKKDGEFGILVGNRVGSVGCKVCVGRGSEDDRGLGFLSDSNRIGDWGMDGGGNRKSGGEDETHLAKGALKFLVQCTEPQPTHVARPMVARRQGIILDGFGAYPADGGRGVIVLVSIGGGEGLGNLLRNLFRYSLVCRRRELVIAVVSGGFVSVGPVAGPTASPAAISPSIAVSRWHCSSFGGRRGRHAECRW